MHKESYMQVTVGILLLFKIVIKYQMLMLNNETRTVECPAERHSYKQFYKMFVFSRVFVSDCGTTTYHTDSVLFRIS